MGKTRLQTAGGAAAGVAGDAAGAPTVSGAAGFTRLGVAGGSLAAAAQATLHATPAGFSSVAMVGGIGAAAAAGAGYAIYRFVNRSEGEGVVH